MQTKVILGIIVVLAATVGGLFFFSGKNTPPSMTEKQTVSATELNNLPATTDAVTPVSAATVTYTENGFIPTSVEIQKGESVEFKNESGESVWVASAMHPTHAVYPQKSEGDCLGSSFDACKAVESGSSWTFTFTEVGSWNYHNHVQASHWGTVVVK